MKLNIRKIIFPAAIFAMSAFAVSAAEIRHSSKSGVTFIVSEDGLSSIRIGEREVAKGGWSFFNPGTSCPSISNTVKVGDITEKSMEKLESGGAKVLHVQGDVSASYIYTFNGEDVHIRALVENHCPTDDMKMGGFQGLTFSFKNEPQGMLCSTPLQQMDAYNQWFKGGIISHCHPSFGNSVGGCYRQDGEYGFGGSPANTGLARTLFHGTPVKKTENAFEQGLEYLMPGVVPRGGSRSYEITLRVSPNTDWKHLMQPYKDYFNETHGPVKYRFKGGPIVMAVVASGSYHCSVNDPLGMKTFTDTPSLNRYCDNLLPQMKKAGCQGIIYWGLGGWEPRGELFRTDFDIFPPAIQRNIPILRERFEEAGMTLGLCTRPRQMTVRGTWTNDWTFDVNPEDLQHLESQIWIRFKKMIDQGFTLYYLDTFGGTFEDVLVMRFLREKMGPEIQTYTEDDCDIMLVYSGVYDYVKYDEKTGKYSVGSPDEICRWLVPEAMGAIVNTAPEKQLKGKIFPNEYLLSNHFAPLVAGYQFSLEAEELGQLTKKYVDEEGNWKSK